MQIYLDGKKKIKRFVKKKNNYCVHLETFVARLKICEIGL